MYQVMFIRCKGGSSKGERAQMKALKEQKILDAKLEEIDTQYYEMRQENKRMYDSQFRPMEESLLRRAMGGATESTSAEARASEYDAADASSSAALARRNERMGVRNEGTDARGDDEYIRAIALNAVGNVSKISALETHSNLQRASMGLSVDVNQDIGREYGRSITGMQMGLGHADAAFQNFSNQQEHLNNAYMHKQAGYSALIKTGASVIGMGISNFGGANESSILSGEGPITGFGGTMKAAMGGGHTKGKTSWF